MSIRKVKTSAGEMKWEVRIHENGRGSKRITRRFERKNDAEAFVQELKQEFKTRDNDPFSGISLKDRFFKDEAQAWLEDGRLRFSETHLKRVRGILNRFVTELGELSMDKFTPELLSKVQRASKDAGHSNSTVNRETEVITAILNFSTKNRRIPFNPSIGFRKLRKDSAEMKFWNQEEAVSFLSHMNERYPKDSNQRWIYVVYLLALNTGLRAGEIWGLQVQDISPQGDSLWIRRQFNRVTLKFGPTKGKKARHVQCSPDLLSELKDLVSKNQLKAEDVIFINENRNPVCHENFVQRTFHRDLSIWGGQEIRFHDMRHTAVTLLIANGIDLKTVKEIAGHADIATTMNYVHLLSGSIGNVSRVFSLSPKLAVEEGEVKKVQQLKLV